MQKILVTGASGFVGSHIADELSASGYSTILYDKTESPYKKDNQTFIKGDLLDSEKLNDITKGVDYVYHFGAIADIDFANQMPAKTLNTNIIGTVNVIEACLKNKIKKLMFASSVYVFSELGGFYAASKKACENIIENYGKSYELKYTILRYGSLYGPRANIKNGMYRAIEGILQNDIYQYDGTGEEVREFINILDAAKISVQCLDEKFDGETLVLTGAEKLKMKDLIEMIKEITQRNTKVEYLGGRNKLHYNMTPYNYAPKIGRKITINPYTDIGQGILELVKEILQEESK